ncbi:hypothetical protein DUK53_04905 [Listeria sp. SHR_NRA_18]|uniref:immunoglobulin-like domain-containing protein n=1 Tax=Listeria TaxID=1637 RepID=UPI00051D8604|nr:MULTISPECIES: immunoglobulin-like domain-containing protein [Listeria]KGL42140.1 hypothetical protein EP56_10415 [Listeriaceae bacterium FSL A5-0209]KMT63325.1 hypothetical protein X559_0321 [Listeria newyorkensis]RQW67659.1 hypothetical protein DUK53_04905 [Listeria sp. SHR_NRA_18]
MKKGKMMKKIVLAATVTSAVLVASIFGTPIKSLANEVENQEGSRIIESKAALLTNELTGLNPNPMSASDINPPVTKAAIPVDFLKNTEFKGFDNWTPLWWNETYHHGGDDWIESMDVTAAKFTAANNEGFSGVSDRPFQARANSDGSVDLRGGVRSDLSFDETGQDEYFDNQGGIFQTFATIPGHTYQFKAKGKVLEASPDDYEYRISISDGNVPKISDRYDLYYEDKVYKDSVQFKATSTVSNVLLRVQGDAVIQFSELKLYDRTEVAPTTITSASDIMDPEAGVISGTGEPNSTVKIYESVYNYVDFNTIQIGSGTVGADGKWTVSIPTLIINDDVYGYYNRVYATTETDGFISKSRLLPIAPFPSMTLLSFMYGEDTYIRGNYMGLITQVELQVNNEAKERVNITNGKIQYNTKNFITSAEDKVKLIGYNSAGKQIFERTVNVVPEPKPGDGELFTKPHVVGQQIEGTYTGKVDKVSVQINGVDSGKYPVFADGTFKIYRWATEINDKVTVIGYNSAGRKVCETKVAIIPKNFAIALSDYRVADAYIEGRYTGPVAKVGLIVNGVAKQQINVTDGIIKYYSKPLITKTTDKVTLVGYNSDGLVVGQKNVTIKDNVNVTPSTYYTDDQYVKGAYTGDVSKISLTVNGVEGSKILVSGDNFQYYAAKLIKNTTDIVYINTYDGLGNFINKTLVPVALKGKITATNAYQIGTDNYVTGHYTGGIAKVELQINGVAKQRINVTGGTIKYYAKLLITNATDKVTLVAYDSAGSAVSSANVLIKTNISATANPFVLGTGYVSGTYAGSVGKISLTVNDVEGTKISVSGNNFQYYSSKIIKNASDVVYVNTYDGLGNFVNKTLVSVIPKGKITDKVTLVGYSSAGSAVSSMTINIK